MDEPQPLDINSVLFLFSFLGAGIIISMIMAAGENVMNSIKLQEKGRDDLETRTIERGMRIRGGIAPRGKKGKQR